MKGKACLSWSCWMPWSGLGGKLGSPLHVLKLSYLPRSVGELRSMNDAGQWRQVGNGGNSGLGTTCTQLQPIRLEGIRALRCWIFHFSPKQNSQIFIWSLQILYLGYKICWAFHLSSPVQWTRALDEVSNSSYIAHVSLQASYDFWEWKLVYLLLSKVQLDQNQCLKF